MAVHIRSLGEFDEKLVEAGSNLAVVYFYEPSNDACQVISPTFDKLTNEFENVVFYRVDVDEDETIAEEYKIDNTPTFIFFKNQKQVDRMVGASAAELKNLIVQHH